jgi:tetratricopeptide (TPR) repeat protein
MLLFWGGLAVIRDQSAPPAPGRRRPWLLAVAAAFALVSGLPYLASLRLEAGRAQLQAGAVSTALGHFQAAGRLYPLDPLSPAFQAYAHLLAWRSTGDRGRLDQAVVRSERAARLDPHNAPVRNQLGLLYAERAETAGGAEDARRARRELTRAVELFPWWAEYRYHLAYWKWRQGDEAGALAEAEFILEREAAFRRPILPGARAYADGLFAEIRVLAAHGRRAAGDRSAARRLAEEALALVPDHAEAKRLLVLLGGEAPR